MHRAPASNEHGFALIEAIVSAAVLALIAVAILSGIDGATSSAGREKARAIAASLAEADQERMRSMPVEELAGYDETREVDGVSYTIKSESRWVRDDTGGTPSCVNNERESDYLRIKTTVTAPGATRTPAPVEITSLVAPSVAYSSTRGSLAVQVTNRDGLPIQNLAVTISGASSDSALTNEDGCALFEYIPEGTYVAQLSTPGWVDVWGNDIGQADINVTPGNLNVLPMLYDQAATATVTFATTYPSPQTTSPVIASAGTAASLTNGEKPGLRRVITSDLPYARKLFPFKTPYAAYAGRCRDSDPTLEHPNYFSSNPGLGATAALNPNGSGAMTVRQPPLSLRVRDRNNNYVTGATVYAKLRTASEDGSTCDEPTFVMTTRNNPGRTSDNTAWASRAGTNFDSGLPFGYYDICVQVGSGSSRRYRRSSTPYDNTNPAGQTGSSSNGYAAMRLDADDSGSC